jgi:hypothetical protein
VSDAISKAIEAMDMARSAVGPFGVVVTRKLTESIEALQALQHSGEPVVPPQWRVVMRGMVEYAECNDPGNPYLDQAKALLSAGKENNK